MPLYEYLCDACGNRFEAIRKFSDAPLETCPKCGGRIQKLISAPAFQLKGTGWYATDFAGKGKTEKAEGKSQTAEGKSAETAGEKSETRSESTKDTAPAKTESTPAKSESPAPSSAPTKD